MQQLWLMGQRVDSIAHLQGVFAKVTEENQLSILVEKMLDHKASGVLKAWLDRQAPSSRLPIEEILEPLSSNEDENVSQETICRSLAKLCGIDEIYFQNQKVHLLHQAKDKIKQEREGYLTQHHNWWKAYGNELNVVTDWNYVVTNNLELQNALNALPQAVTTKTMTVYLCSVENCVFSINLRGKYSAIFKGVGNPVVRLRRLRSGENIDAKAQDLQLLDMTLQRRTKESVINHDDNKNKLSQVMI